MNTVYAVMALYTFLEVGGEKREIDNAVGFFPVFETEEEAKEFANGLPVQEFAVDDEWSK